MMSRRKSAVRLLALVLVVAAVCGWPVWKHYQFEKERTETPPYLIPDLQLKLLWIPAGTFNIGTGEPSEWLLKVKGAYNDAKPWSWPVWERGPFPDWEEGPAREVHLRDGFYLGETEVTQEQWVAVMGNNPSQFKGGKDSSFGLSWPRFYMLYLDDKNPLKLMDHANWFEKWEKARVMINNVPINYVGGSYPVETVSWFRCLTFCQKLTERERAAGRLPQGWVYRLPSEEEREVACRAGNSGRFCFGNDISVLNNYAWVDENSNFLPHEVAKKKPNLWGFYDMYGNVEEWCAGEYGIHEVPTNFTDVATVGLIKGGNYGSRREKCGSAFRIGISPDSRSSIWGLRLVLGPELPKVKRPAQGSN